MCSQKECPTKFETRWLQEIPFSKELTDNYCALGLLFESKICNNNNKVWLKTSCPIGHAARKNIAPTFQWIDRYLNFWKWLIQNLVKISLKIWKQLFNPWLIMEDGCWDDVVVHEIKTSWSSCRNSQQNQQKLMQGGKI